MSHRRDTAPPALAPTLALALVLGPALAVGPACRHKEGRARAAAIPASLSIAVQIDGKPAPPIDAARLGAVPPDYVSGERRAWRLSTLLGEACARPDAVVEVEGEGGRKTVFERPAHAPDGREPVLALNRRGDVVVALMKKDDPFPEFHGRGEKRGRSGDPATRVRDVKQIRVYGLGGPGGGGRGDRRAREGAPVQVATFIDGRPGPVWTLAKLGRAKTLSILGDGGEGTRDAWSLKELAATLVGPGAVVTQLVDDTGKTLALDPAAWADASKIPVVRVNRRGMLRFQWANAELAPIAGEDLRGVAQIHLTTSK